MIRITAFCFLIFLVPFSHTLAIDVNLLPKDKTLFVGLTKPLPDISGIGSNEVSSNQISFFIYDLLFNYNQSNGYEYSKLLATNYTSNAKKDVWYISIRKNVKFHNGDALTAHDVKFSFDTANTKENPRGDFLSKIKEIVVVNDYKLKFQLKTPKPRFIEDLLYNMPTLPKKLVQKIGIEAFRQNPIGSGPYKFVQMEKSKYLLLERNEKYWGGVPRIKYILIKFNLTPQVINIEMEAQNLDVVPELALTNLNLGRLKKKVVIHKPESFDYYFLSFNLQGKPTSDLRFRKAILQAFDFKTFINDLFKHNDGGQLAYSPIPPAMWPQDLEFQKQHSISYNPQEAAKAFDELEKEGVLDRKAPLTLLCRGRKYRTIILKSLANKLAFDYKFTQINFVVEPNWNKFVAALPSVHMYTFGMGFDAPTPNMKILYNASTYNYNGYNDDQVNQWIQAEGKETNKEKRSEYIVKVIRKAVYQDYIWRMLFHGKNFFLTSKRINGLYVSGVGYYHLFLPFEKKPISAFLQ